MNKKILKSVIILVVACLIPVLLLTACAKEKNVSSIQIVQGSFKEIYALDENINLSHAKLLVTYTDGSTANVSITSAMVSGFDTSTTTTGRTLTVTYKGKSANFIYKVQNSVSVETAFRFNLGVAENEAKNGYEVSIKAQNVGDGIYALRFTLSTSGGIALIEPTLKLGSEFKMQIYSSSASSMVIVVYSYSGYDSVPEGAEIFAVKATKPNEKGTINIQNASVSDGANDFIVPQAEYKIGE